MLTFQKDFFYHAISDMLHKIFSKLEHLMLHQLVNIFIFGPSEIRMTKNTFCKGFFFSNRYIFPAASLFRCYFLNHKSKLCLSRGSCSSVAWMSCCYLDLPLNVIFKLQREPRPLFFYIPKNCNWTFGLKRILFIQEVSSYFYHKESKEQNSASLRKLNLKKITLILL